MSPTRIFGANASVGESMSLVPADEGRLAEGRTGYGNLLWQVCCRCGRRARSRQS